METILTLLVMVMVFIVARKWIHDEGAPNKENEKKKSNKFSMSAATACLLSTAFASGSAEAAFKLTVENLDTNEVLQIPDNGAGDINLLPGQITATVTAIGINAVVNAISREDRNTPRLLLNVDGLNSSNLVNISITDTGYTVFEISPGKANVASGVQ